MQMQSVPDGSYCFYVGESPWTSIRDLNIKNIQVRRHLRSSPVHPHAQKEGLTSKYEQVPLGFFQLSFGNLQGNS